MWEEYRLCSRLQSLEFVPCLLFMSDSGQVTWPLCLNSPFLKCKSEKSLVTKVEEIKEISLCLWSLKVQETVWKWLCDCYCSYVSIHSLSTFYWKIITLIFNLFFHSSPPMSFHKPLLLILFSSFCTKLVLQNVLLYHTIRLWCLSTLPCILREYLWIS